MREGGSERSKTVDIHKGRPAAAIHSMSLPTTQSLT